MNVSLRDDFKFITWLAHFWRALHITMQFGLYHVRHHVGPPRIVSTDFPPKFLAGCLGIVHLEAKLPS